MTTVGSPAGPLAALALALTLATPRADASAEPQPSGSSRYQRTVQSLQLAQPELLPAFAETALAELAAIYLAEADLARSEARESAAAAKLMGWSLAVEAYAQDMLVLLEEVQAGLPVSLWSGPHEAARLSVAGRLIILSHPRATQQGEFEQRVLMDFCSRVDCSPLTAEGAESRPVPVSASLVTPAWSFAPGSAVCSHRQLSLRFRGSGDLARQRSLCHQLFQELALLANELAWQRRHGVAVEWEALSIYPVPRQPEHVVTLNAAGDSILASVPLLHSTPGLLSDVTPWLRAAHDNRPVPAVELEPGRYGWEESGR